MIVGGGLAGLISSIQLIRAGISCTVLEKKSYPLHRVCGEYVSNEALAFLKSSGLYPGEYDLPKIKFLEFSSVGGHSARLPLGLGGFGVSRYTFDHYLFNVARKEGVDFMLNTEVSAIDFLDERFVVKARSQEFYADVVIGSFGKRSRIDVQQKRNFIGKRSPFLGVKYHVRTDHPRDQISLHNFSGGYCGVCAVENGITNLCYLTHSQNLKEWGEVQEMERQVLLKNPHLKRIFSEADFVFGKPEVINEISFETKDPVENHILMAGDAAGMITPVCGNGMAIAIHSGKMLAAFVQEFCADAISRNELEEAYRIAWQRAFSRRLWFGRNVQGLFGQAGLSTMAVNLARLFPVIARSIVNKTHGEPF